MRNLEDSEKNTFLRKSSSCLTITVVTGHPWWQGAGLPKPWIYGTCTAPATQCQRLFPAHVWDEEWLCNQIFQMLVIHLSWFCHSKDISIGPELYNLAGLGGAERPLISLSSSERQEAVTRTQVWGNRSLSRLYKATEELEKWNVKCTWQSLRLQEIFISITCWSASLSGGEKLPFILYLPWEHLHRAPTTWQTLGSVLGSQR